MRREFALAAMFVLVAMPALAAARCNQPYAPQFRDGAGATKEDIVNMRDDAQTFITASDIYQACLLKAASQQDAKVKVERNSTRKSARRKRLQDGCRRLQGGPKGQQHSVA